MTDAPKLKRSRIGRVKSRDALAERYGINVRNIARWLLAGAPRRRNGYYNLKDWDAWVEKYKSAESGKDDTLAAVNLQLKQEELLQKRAARAQLEGRRT